MLHPTASFPFAMPAFSWLNCKISLFQKIQLSMKEVLLPYCLNLLAYSVCCQFECWQLLLNTITKPSFIWLGCRLHDMVSETGMKMNSGHYIFWTFFLRKSQLKYCLFMWEIVSALQKPRRFIPYNYVGVYYFRVSQSTYNVSSNRC